MVCEYCRSSSEAGERTCDNCGAPLAAAAGVAGDFRSCPYCGRRLLALASPACSYCGRRLPENFIKTREADLHRITTELGHTTIGPGHESKLEHIVDILLGRGRSD